MIDLYHEPTDVPSSILGAMDHDGRGRQKLEEPASAKISLMLKPRTKERFATLRKRSKKTAEEFVSDLLDLFEERYDLVTVPVAEDEEVIYAEAHPHVNHENTNSLHNLNDSSHSTGDVCKMEESSSWPVLLTGTEESVTVNYDRQFNLCFGITKTVAETWTKKVIMQCWPIIAHH